MLIKTTKPQTKLKKWRAFQMLTTICFFIIVWKRKLKKGRKIRKFDAKFSKNQDLIIITHFTNSHYSDGPRCG